MNSTLDIALVGPGFPCGDHPAPAGSVMEGPLFDATIRHAVSLFDLTYILHPRDVLVEPQEVIAPFHGSLLRRGPSFVYSWGRRAVSTLRTRHPVQHLSLQIFASRFYARPIVHYLEVEVMPYWDWGEPLHHMSYGERLLWFETQKDLHDPF